jgi:hypothetical protein
MNLSRIEMVWARDAFAAIFPGPRSSGQGGVEAMDIEGYLADTFRRISWEPALGLRAAIWIAALAPLFVLGRWRTIHGLAAADRERVLVGLTSSPVYAVRQLTLALKTMAALLWAGDPAVRADLLAPGAAPIRLRATMSREGGHARVA